VKGGGEERERETGLFDCFCLRKHFYFSFDFASLLLDYFNLSSIGKRVCTLL